MDLNKLIKLILGITLHKCDFDMANMTHDPDKGLIYTCTCGETQSVTETARKLFSK